MKYGFPKRQGGRVSITLQRDDEGRMQSRIREASVKYLNLPYTSLLFIYAYERNREA